MYVSNLFRTTISRCNTKKHNKSQQDRSSSSESEKIYKLVFAVMA